MVHIAIGEFAHGLLAICSQDAPPDGRIAPEEQLYVTLGWTCCSETTRSSRLEDGAGTDLCGPGAVSTYVDAREPVARRAGRVGVLAMNFTGHSLLGLLAGSLAAMAVAVAGPSVDGLPVPLVLPVATLVLVYLGAVYPDVDLHGSIPRRRVRPYLQAGAVGGVALVAATRWTWFVRAGHAVGRLLDVRLDSVVAGAGAALGAAGLAVLAVEPALDLATGPHRTWTHSLVVNGVLAAAAAVLLWVAVPVAGDARLAVAALPGAFLCGVAVHLVADRSL